MSRLRITARMLPDGKPFTVRGQEAATLALLLTKGSLGVTAFDFRGGPPFRLPAYCHTLKRRHGLVIVTEREEHDGGWHGRFKLLTAVEVIQCSEVAA
jgi:hypothetical protein